MSNTTGKAPSVSVTYAVKHPEGDRERALEWNCRALTMEPDDPVVIWNAACIYTVAGRLDEALDQLEKAIDLGIANRAWVEHDPDMDSLHGHPRFQALLERMDA